MKVFDSRTNKQYGSSLYMWFKSNNIYLNQKFYNRLTKSMAVGLEMQTIFGAKCIVFTTLEKSQMFKNTYFIHSEIAFPMHFNMIENSTEIWDLMSISLSSNMPEEKVLSIAFETFMANITLRMEGKELER